MNSIDAFKKINQEITRQWSLWTWALVLILVNLPIFWGEVRTELLYWPEAVHNGQWWRIITFPLVHLSWYHFLLDAGGFLILYSCLEEKQRLLKALYVIGPGVGSLLFTLAFDPNVNQHGLSGLSGIAHGLMAITALEMVFNKNQRTWGIVSLTIVLTKSLYEFWSGHVLFEFIHMGMCGLPLAATHVGGVLGGLITFGIVKITN